MVLNLGGFLPPSCVLNAPCKVYNEYSVICGTYKEPALDIAEVISSTMEQCKKVHTISQVFLPNFILGNIISRYTLHILHYPIIIRLPMRVS